MLLQWIAVCVAAISALGGPYWDHPHRRANAERWARTIVESSFEQGQTQLNPLVVVCVIFAESSFRPEARGQRGEIGLFQVMPRGQAAAGRSERELADPDENIRVGIEGLRRGIDECGQGTAGALAWHNLGRCSDDPEEVAFVRRIRGLYRRVRHLRTEAPDGADPTAGDPEIASPDDAATLKGAAGSRE
jgi:hypothetical protein